MNKKLIAQLVLVFLITQLVGLYVAGFCVQEDIHATIVSEDPNDPLNSIALFAYILAFTAGLLAAMFFLKKRAGYFLKAFELLAVFATSWIVASVFVGDLIGIAFAILLTASRIVLSENILLRNAASIIAIIGAGALLGVSLGVVPVIVFVILLSAYDFIAVFKTKHMVTLAKAMTKKNLAFTIALPTKEHKFELGTGDLVVPLVFASAVLQEASVNAAFLVLAGSLIGLLITINYSSKHIGKALPALPLQGALMIALFAVAKIAGF